MALPDLKAVASNGGSVESVGENHWRLRLPPGPAGQYRLAQLDDYRDFNRAHLPWQPPASLRLQARLSGNDLPGTWGFGFWNDPFSVGLGLAGSTRRLPAPPQAVWFFYASPPNYLAFRDNHPAQGFLAATFASASIPWPLSLAAIPALPFLLWPRVAGQLRRLARRFIREDAALVEVDPTGWHAYAIDWERDGARFVVDGVAVFETAVSPRAGLGLVLWIDNQYAACLPDGRLRLGTMAQDAPAWLELEEIEVTKR